MVVSMSVKKEAAARHRPFARGASGARKVALAERESATSETRLQAAVAPVSRGRDERDPYADVPCTD
jgi:hypothetical protein